ncbi:prepilin-type N-terminal cleavage/methylation domain-containing protein [Paucibacter sp. APW11]|uniref:Prepilin-type N-terminal cleavage/methylation domain-containing protein n=1 Tax=Roseateles aquae TaxID=3077235 RepID=A0ABU3PE74_9BURK|nr:prepilin-type N-terminal cleavage/methylation domain-containing protein [Paucibacter sp. APW11]MDT9000915.1 prepilin-type N-terminal cleavage/methylation domain-containing protein [Paucibacter sp. APW11]
MEQPFADHGQTEQRPRIRLRRSAGLAPPGGRAQRVGGGQRHGGFTLIELIVVMAIVALLSSIVAPRYFASLQKSRETAMRSSLAVMRDAIDQYAADKGHYPESLQELAAARYLREIPEDPLLGKRDGWVELGPPPDAQLKGQLYDIRSGAAGRGSDGRLYADW